MLTATSVAAAYAWVDRPLSYFSHDHLAQWRVFFELQRLPEYLTVLVVLIFVLTGLAVLARGVLSRFLSVLLVSGVSLAAAALIKDQLKFVFGRSWPETWINNNPSLIRDGAFGFNPFHGGVGYASFPSGHMTLTCAAVSVLWFAYPNYRVLYAVVIAAVLIGLIGANYHFLSDTIAGGFLGWCTGWITVLIWDGAGVGGLSAPRE